MKRAYRMQGKANLTNVKPDKPARKHTKPEVRKQLADSGGQVTASRADKVYRDRMPATNVALTQQTENNNESGKSKKSSHGGVRPGAGRPRKQKAALIVP